MGKGQNQDKKLSQSRVVIFLKYNVTIMITLEEQGIFKFALRSFRFFNLHSTLYELIDSDYSINIKNLNTTGIKLQTSCSRNSWANQCATVPETDALIYYGYYASLLLFCREFIVRATLRHRRRRLFNRKHFCLSGFSKV